VKDQYSFLDLIAKQIEHTSQCAGDVDFMLMNSFSTSVDTRGALSKYDFLGEWDTVELMQNKVPKVDRATMRPVVWEQNTTLEWCPPGHGDLYAALAGKDADGVSKLDKLLEEGKKIMFVSNSDNLGATLDLDLMTYFLQSDKPFLMEVAERTENDKKGGHLAKRKSDGRLILRESAQCSKEDEAEFQNTSKHQYFNTNNLWVRLDKLKELMEAAGGFIDLPMIKNSKTVDPQSDKSTPVFQLETAMGAAIECFDGADAIVVTRKRFAPVKKCNDLLLLRSDVYAISENFTLQLAEGVEKAPVVDLDDKHFKLVHQLDAAIAGGVPSLAKCTRLKVSGPVAFAAGVSFVGEVEIVNDTHKTMFLPSGEYKDEAFNVQPNSPSRK
jgi:UDP-N-acetylglucosamine pyrophosphorylase